MSEQWEDPSWQQKVNCWDKRKGRGEGTAYKGFSPMLIARQKENHTVSRVNTWLSRSYPQSDKVWSTEDRAWRRGKCRVYGIVREEFFSWINSHVVDVLKVARRGDQTGVMMRELIRGTLLSKTTERESNEGWLYSLHGHQQFHKSSETQSRDSRQQTLLAVSTQGLTLPPPVLWAPSWHRVWQACCPCCC